jgi:hypothetical protein
MCVDDTSVVGWNQHIAMDFITNHSVSHGKSCYCLPFQSISHQIDEWEEICIASLEVYPWQMV